MNRDYTVVQKYRLSRPSLAIVATIIASLTLSLLRFGPLAGTPVALIGVVTLQIYLLGWLVTRVFGQFGVSHPVTRFALTLFTGLVINILIGSVFRFLRLPIPAFLVLLHSLMLLCALWKPRSKSVDTNWIFLKTSIPFYITIFVCCITFMGFGLVTAQFHFAGEFSDRGLFASLIDGLANNTVTTGLFNRQLGQGNDPRIQIDGWTYSNAVWTYSSGIRGDQFLWNDEIPLFIWTVPLIIFALAYELSGREDLATWSTVVLVFFAIQTFDPIFYKGMPGFSGRHPIFDLRTLREVSTTIILALSLLVTVIFVRKRTWQILLLLVASMGALISLHPRTLLIFLLLSGGVGLIYLIALRTRIAINRYGLIGLIFAVLLVIALGVFLLKYRIPGFLAPFNSTAICTTTAASTLNGTGSLIYPVELPLLGASYIIAPNRIFFHPLIIIVIMLGIVIGWRRRHELFGRFQIVIVLMSIGIIVLPVVVYSLSVLFSRNLLLGDPCLLDNIFVNNLLDNVAGAVSFSILVMLPITLGYSIQWLVDKFPPAYRYGNILVAVISITTLALTIFEPISIPQSARDQVKNMADSYAHLNIQTADQLLADQLRGLLPKNKVSNVLTTAEAGGTIIESVPNTFVLIISNDGFTSNPYQADPSKSPWLGTDDFNVLKDRKINDVVVRITDTRYPQMIMDTERFTLIGTIAGYATFQVNETDFVSPSDALFTRMNVIYDATHTVAWDELGLSNLGLYPLAQDDAVHQIIVDWKTLYAAHPETPQVAYGLALTYLLQGDYAHSIQLWEDLQKRFPVLSEPLAFALMLNGQPTEAVNVLINMAQSRDTNMQLMAGRAMLRDRFFYALQDDQIQSMLNTITVNYDEWRNLRRTDIGGAFEKRIELLMGRGFWVTVANWLDDVAHLEINEKQYAMRGLALLAQGDTNAALDHLHWATDYDWMLPRQRLHFSRWEKGYPAQLYYILSGNLAEQEGDTQAAGNNYHRAIASGSVWAAPYFLSRLTGDAAGLEKLKQAWSQQYQTGFPDLLPLTAIADSHAIYVVQPEVINDDDQHTLTVQAAYGFAFEEQFPVADWYLHLRSEDAATLYSSVHQSPMSIPGALVLQSLLVKIPADVAELTTAHLFVEANHNAAVNFGQISLPLVLNRPTAVAIPPDAVPTEVRFGDSIQLIAYKTDLTPQQITVTLYWNTTQTLQQDYQVSIQVVDSSGAIVLQKDNGPVAGRYPSSQWRIHTPIRDSRSIPIEAALADGQYRVFVTLYSMPDLVRLPVSPSDQSSNSQLLLKTIDYPKDVVDVP